MKFRSSSFDSGFKSIVGYAWIAMSDHNVASSSWVYIYNCNTHDITTIIFVKFPTIYIHYLTRGIKSEFGAPNN